MSQSVLVLEGAPRGGSMWPASSFLQALLEAEVVWVFVSGVVVLQVPRVLELALTVVFGLRRWLMNSEVARASPYSEECR